MPLSPERKRMREEVRNSNNKIVGNIYDEADGFVLEKRGLVTSKHRLRVPDAWATDSAHLARLRKVAGMETPASVRLFVDGSTIWETSLDNFVKHGITIDRGFGKQVALPDRYWRTNMQEQGRLF